MFQNIKDFWSTFRPECVFRPKPVRTCFTVVADCQRNVQSDETTTSGNEWLSCPAAWQDFHRTCAANCGQPSAECLQSVSKLQLAGVIPENGCSCEGIRDYQTVSICRNVQTVLYNSSCFGSNEINFGILKFYVEISDSSSSVCFTLSH